MIHQDVDAVIVGAGAAGSYMAEKLATAGKRVVVLEAGPPWHLRDLYSSEIWARRLKWAPGPTVTQGAAPIAVNYNLGGGFGGAALHHYANWFRMHPGDFKEKSLWGENLDWPISYEDLSFYYDYVQEEVGVSGSTDQEVWRPESAPYPMPPLQNFGQGELLMKGFAAVGLRSSPSPHAINSVEYKGRNACLLDGWCEAGCPIGALANPLTISFPGALAAGAEFRHSSNVTGIVTDPSGKRVAGVSYRDKAGADQYQPASVVIMASSAVQTPRLLLASATPKHPTGLANSSNTVGLGMMSNAATTAFGLFDQETEPYRGPVAYNVMSQDAYDQKRNEAYFGSYSLVGGGAIKPNDLLGIANSRGDLFGAPLAAFMQRAANHIVALSTLVESRPLPQNRLTLSTQADSSGVPIPQIDHAFDDDALQADAVALAQAMAVIKAAGATEVFHGRQGTQHITGGTIMGTDPSTSVTNSYGRTHDLPNLVITGAGLFPTTGAVNPTFTIYALALRTSEYLLNNWADMASAR